MNAIVIEHVKLEELPAAWRAKLLVAPGTQGRARVTVRIDSDVLVWFTRGHLPAAQGLQVINLWADFGDDLYRACAGLPRHSSTRSRLECRAGLTQDSRPDPVSRAGRSA
jgi:hypothetical protein